MKTSTSDSFNSPSAPQRSPSEIRNPKSKIQNPPSPPLLALFQKRIEGDDALLRLASLRFREAGLGPEFYAETPAELEWLLGFWPSAERPVVVHLKRELDILSKESRELIDHFAESFRGRLLGLVIHDQPELATRPGEYLAALREIGNRLEQLPVSPMLFLEYASGLDPALYIKALESLRGLKRISGCLDVGHLGLWQVRTAYARRHPGIDACSLIPEAPELPEVVNDLQDAVLSALPLVVEVIGAVGSLGKPLHFHLHDGHPLSTASPFGVSDHLSFLDEIPIPFEHEGRCALPLMFGLTGLATLVATALGSRGPDSETFSLEIHPTEGALPLGCASDLFLHWLDKTNAERMNYWLSVLLHNHQLLKAACCQGMIPKKPAPS